MKMKQKIAFLKIWFKYTLPKIPRETVEYFIWLKNKKNYYEIVKGPTRPMPLIDKIERMIHFLWVRRPTYYWDLK